MKQAFSNFLKKFEVNGYSPLAMFNIVLALITLIGAGILYLLFDNFGFSGAFDLRGTDKTFLMVALVATPVCFIWLIIRNLKMKSVPKIILYTVLQFVLAIIIAAIYLIVFFFAGLFGGSSSTTQTTKTYTDQENQYAKANGYYDAQTANQQGFSTAEANNPGFDYTQKRD